MLLLLSTTMGMQQRYDSSSRHHDSTVLAVMDEVHDAKSAPMCFPHVLDQKLVLSGSKRKSSRRVYSRGESLEPFVLRA